MPDAVSITVTENGPLSVKGPFRLFDADSNEYDISERRRIIGAPVFQPACSRLSQPGLPSCLVGCRASPIRRS